MTITARQATHSARFGWVAFVFALGVATFAQAAPPAQLSRTQVEAAYLFNFARFVDWPSTSFADDQAPLVLGVIGQDPFGALLDDLVTGEKIKGRSIVVRRFSRVQDITDCHILYVARSEADRVARICAALQNRHVLTVSDIPGFVRQGGIIELVDDQERIRFRIALKRARAELLEVSAKLLRPAEVVSQDPAETMLARTWTRLPTDDAASLAALLLPALMKLSSLPITSDATALLRLR